MQLSRDGRSLGRENRPTREVRAVKIVDNDSYRRALERANRLRNQKKTAETSTELADLEAAIEHYDLHPDRPARSTGRPQPDPYDQEDS